MRSIFQFQKSTQIASADRRGAAEGPAAAHCWMFGLFTFLSVNRLQSESVRTRVRARVDLCCAVANRASVIGIKLSDCDKVHLALPL